MKAKDIARAKILVEARADLLGLLKAARRDRVEEVGSDWRGLSISVADYCAGGHSSSGHVDLDLVSGRRLIAKIKAIIDDELAKLRVTG